ncbi:hypothetical protein ACWC4D_33745 [Streptomyces sp. NPDC001288]
MRLPWKRRQRPTLVRRPDYTAIAVLEHELFGIQPQPGTVAAAIIGMRHLQAALAQQLPLCGPEFGTGAVARPHPVLLDADERLVPLRRASVLSARMPIADGSGAG